LVYFQSLEELHRAAGVVILLAAGAFIW